MRRLVRTLLLALPLAAASACGSSGGNPVGPVTIEQTTFAPSLNINLSQYTKAPEGYYYRDLVAGGGGQAASGDSLIIGATGYLADGSSFYTTNGQVPISLRLGTTKLLPGWTLGLVGAPVGGTRRLILPPELAYGSTKIVDVANLKVIPANSVVVFDIPVFAKVP